MNETEANHKALWMRVSSALSKTNSRNKKRGGQRGWTQQLPLESQRQQHDGSLLSLQPQQEMNKMPLHHSPAMRLEREVSEL